MALAQTAAEKLNELLVAVRTQNFEVMYDSRHASKYIRRSDERLNEHRKSPFALGILSTTSESLGPVTISRRIAKCFSELLRSEGDRLFALIDKERQKDIAYTSRSSLTSAEGDLDCILRYEAHLSREFDRTFNQLERLQSARHISSTD